MLKLAIIGAGVMGSNHARVAAASPGVEVTYVVDPDVERAKALAAHVGARAVATVEELHDQFDAAVIAVPSQLHRVIAEQLAQRGVHLLVEKPLALTVEDAEAIQAAANRTGVILAVGHVERFNPAILELERIVDAPIHLAATRISPFASRVSESVVLDLMIHDLDIVASFASGGVEHVTAISQSLRTATHDLVSALIGFEGGITAAVTASRIGQHKDRTLVITQADSVVTVDLLRQDITIAKMHHAEFTSESGTRYRQSGVVEIPFLEHRGEPLMLEHADFYRCIREGRQPRVDGQQGKAAVALALRVMAATSA